MDDVPNNFLHRGLARRRSSRKVERRARLCVSQAVSWGPIGEEHQTFLEKITTGNEKFTTSLAPTPAKKSLAITRLSWKTYCVGFASSRGGSRWGSCQDIQGNFVDVEHGSGRFPLTLQHDDVLWARNPGNTISVA